MARIKNLGGLWHRGKEVENIGDVYHKGIRYIRVRIIGEDAITHIQPNWLEDETEPTEMVGVDIKKLRKPHGNKGKERR